MRTSWTSRIIVSDGTAAARLSEDRDRRVLAVHVLEHVGADLE